MSQLITINDICVKRANRFILRHVSLEVNANDMITIIGPNGAGKSMLLKAMIGLYLPDHGTIERADHVVMGYVPQFFTPPDTMPIKVKRFLRLNNVIDNAALEQVAIQVGIQKLLNEPLATLSGGQRQRVLLARALLRKPNILLLDEPVQHLDIKGQLEFYTLLEEVRTAHHFAVVMVSHDLNRVMASSSQVVCLHTHICCSGTPDNIANDPAFIEMFGNDMASMVGIYQHHHDHEHGIDTSTCQGDHDAH